MFRLRGENGVGFRKVSRIFPTVAENYFSFSQEIPMSFAERVDIEFFRLLLSSQRP